MTDLFGLLASVRSRITYSYWASPGQNQTLDQLVVQMEAIGNTVIDSDGARLLIGRHSDSEDVWGCRLCLEDGQITILDTETELMAHVAVEHPDWSSE